MKFVHYEIISFAPLCHIHYFVKAFICGGRKWRRNNFLPIKNESEMIRDKEQE
jgi:hypothetical protein